jgi:hypothetical protein
MASKRSRPGTSNTSISRSKVCPTVGYLSAKFILYIPDWNTQLLTMQKMSCLMGCMNYQKYSTATSETEPKLFMKVYEKVYKPRVCQQRVVGITFDQFRYYLFVNQVRSNVSTFCLRRSNMPLVKLGSRHVYYSLTVGVRRENTFGELTFLRGLLVLITNSL